MPLGSRARSLPANILPGPRRQSTLTSIVLRKKNEIDIELEGEGDFVHSYSTFDEIKGNVILKFDKDIQIDELIITFEGQSATFVEKIATTAPTAGRTTGKHTFLKLLQPVDSDQLPECNLLLAGETYSIPFTFVVPDRLLPYICSHKVENEEYRKQHVQLPPSMGDPATSGDGHVLMDDMAPAMSRVSYAIRARATTRLANGKVVDIAHRLERIRIVPAKEEEPPKAIEGKADYTMRKEKPVKKGLFKIGKVGQITAETAQPRSLRLPHPAKRISESEPVTTMTTVNLRFDPATPDDQPPQLGSIATKLRVYTFFGAAPYKILPEIYRCDNWSNLHGVYPESVELSSRNLSTVPWTRHRPGTNSLSSTTTNSSTTSNGDSISRRPSALSTTTNPSIPEPSALHNPSFPFYTAQILVPVSLPNPYTSKTPRIFIPSFHSCIISRSYSLELNLSYHNTSAPKHDRKPSSAGLKTHIVLKSPIQISAEGGIPRSPADPESDEALVAEIERQFGWYEARQLQELNFELGLDVGAVESPEYEEQEREQTPLLAAPRRQTVADILSRRQVHVEEPEMMGRGNNRRPSLGLGGGPGGWREVEARLGGGVPGVNRRGSSDPSAPPEYHANESYVRRVGLGVGGPRTQSVSDWLLL
jgi:hypothetical protein